MFAIYALFLCGRGLAILGVIALEAVPKLALTATNLLLFILGGSVGMVVFVNISFGLFVVYWISWAFVVRSDHGEIAGYLLLLTWATLGGAGRVRVRTRLQEMPKQRNAL